VDPGRVAVGRTRSYRGREKKSRKKRESVGAIGGELEESVLTRSERDRPLTEEAERGHMWAG